MTMSPANPQTEHLLRLLSDIRHELSHVESEARTSFEHLARCKGSPLDEREAKAIHEGGLKRILEIMSAIDRLN